MEKHTSDAAAQAAAPTPQSGERTFFGHPWGLANLFGVEMWERFSFYGMQALVLLYMYYATTDGGLGLDRADATSIVGAYGGLVYMACLLASLVADRVLGAERTLFYSASMVMLGHIALAFIPAITGLAIGLVLIAIGSGGVKTTAQVVLGAMYSRDDPRREVASPSSIWALISALSLVHCSPLPCGAGRVSTGALVSQQSAWRSA